MRRLFLSLCAILAVFTGYSFAANPSIINHSYNVDGDDVTIYWTDNSEGGTMDINIFNPNIQSRTHFATVDMSDEAFTYTKQRNGEQKIRLIPDDGGEEVQFTIESTEQAVRTVIPAVPKTGPNSHLIGIILASLIVFGGYIFIKRQASL